MLSSLKLGFLGSGALAQNLIQGYIQNSSVKAENVFISSRRSRELFKNPEIQRLSNSSELLEKSQILFLCVKPQDLPDLLQPLKEDWDQKHTILSPVAGVSFKQLKKFGLGRQRLVRFMPNTNVCVGQGLLAFCSLSNKDSLNSFVEELLKPLGLVVRLNNERLLDPLTVACSSGSSFVLELMEYWTEWLAGESFPEDQAKQLVIQTFLGSSLMSQERKNRSFSQLQSEIASKKGISEIGLKNIRALEIERSLRLSFEKCLLRLKEMQDI